MTVKEVTEVMRFAKKFSLVWGESPHEYNPQDDIMVKAFGDYKVSWLNPCGQDKETGSCEECEIGIAVNPIKEGYT